MTLTQIMRRGTTTRLLIGALTSMCLCSTVQGSGFAIIEQGVSGLGNAYAGGAASAEDATTIFFNPAGITRLPAQAVFAGHVIQPSSEFRGSASDLIGDPIATGGSGGDAGDTALVPNFYYVRPVSDRVTLGLGINAPFGLKTEYDSDWVGRFHAITSDLKTVSINPVAGFRLNDRVSIGAGVNVVYSEAELTNEVDYGAFCVAALLEQGDPDPVDTCDGFGLQIQDDTGVGRIKGDDWGVGITLGVLAQLTDQTRVGASYRSSVAQQLKGDASFADAPAIYTSGTFASGFPLFTPARGSADITLPASLSVSAYHEAGEHWSFMGDVTLTRWSSFDELRVKFNNPAQPDSATKEGWDDSLRYALGASYRHNDQWTFRGGVAFDETPIPDATLRTPRIPGNDRTWLTFGAGYRMSNEIKLDFGYAHLSVDDTRINHTSDGISGTITGTYEADVNIVSAQLTWTMD